MKNFNLILVLLASILLNPSFSQTIYKTSEFESITIQTTKNTNGSKNYCPSTFTNITDDSITNVTFNTINNNSGQEGADSYGDYTSMATGLLVGNTYTLSVTFISGSYTQHVWAWIDWNGDEDFNDISEHYDLGEGASTTITFPISVPYTGYTGFTRMRITEQYNTDPNPCDPQSNNYGETEDYLLYVFANNYCSASGGCDEYISEVELYSAADNIIYYSSGCLGYFEWMTPNIQLPINSNGLITVTNGNPYEYDQCGVWVDWNNNDIYDTYESLTVSGSPGEGPYTAYIIPPSGTLLGTYTLRTRIVYNETPVPCGTTTYGEVMDFHFDVTPEITAEWTGAFDNNWHNSDNWSTLKVPDASTDVIIPDVANKCWVYAGTAYCDNLTVNYGSGNDLRIWNQTLIVSGNVEMFGQLLMDHIDGIFEIEGNIDWHAGSSASIQDYALFKVYGDWNFQSGANVTLNNGLVSFSGTGASIIRSYEENCYFNDVVILKASSNWANISNLSTADLHIRGDLAIEPGNNMFCQTPESVFLLGNLVCLGSFVAYDGTMIFDGTNQLIFWNGTGAEYLHFNNLTISSTTETSITNYNTENIVINANLVIEEGQLVSNSYTIHVGGNWDNQVGPGGFDPGTGRVIFDGGNYHQYCSDEYFHILELAKPLGGALRMQGTHVECASYDWAIGAIDVIPGGGSFTAFDLMDNGIFGEFYLNPGGTINLTNTDGFVDLNGELHIFGGTMNIFGGTTYSYWPFNGDALISMYDGVLDFHDQGIYIFDSPTYTLTESISGGTIRTAWGFWGGSGDFTPDYGIMEFYSSNDADIYTDYGCYLNDVLVNKGTKDNLYTKSDDDVKSVPIIDERSGKAISDGTKSNTLIQSGFLDINGSLVIESGVLDTDGYNIQIEGDWTNFVGDAGFIESTGWVTFNDDDNAGSIIHTDETFNNLMLSSSASGIHGLTILDGIEINLISSLDLQLGSIGMGFGSMLHVAGNVFIAYDAGLNASAGENLITVGGNWTNENNPNAVFKGFWSGGETVIFNGPTYQIVNTNATEESFTNLVIEKTSGAFNPNDNIQVFNYLHILNGNWSDNTTGLTHYISGDFMIGATANYYPQGTTSFNGTTDQFYQNDGGVALFGDVVIDKSGSLSLNSDMVVFNSHETTIEEGSLHLNGHWFKSDGNIYINDGGNLLVDTGAFLSIVSGLYVNNGGVFTASGEAGNNATIFKDVVGNHAFEVNSGGTISANHATFSQMNPNGIWVKNGAIVDPLNAFNNCTFGAGENGFGAIRLTINNDQILNLDNVSFIDNPFISGSINVGKYYDWGELQFTNFSGNFSGPDYEDDQHDRIHWMPSEYRVEARVFLEGPLNGTYMTPALNPLLPLNHPFNPPLPYFGNPMPDWYYLAGGSVGFIPDPDVVDWVLVQLRDANSPGAALPSTTIATTPAFLMEDGTIIAMDGSTQLTFEVTPVNDLFLVIWQRNHLGVISANPLTEVGGVYPYDFSIGASQAYGGASAQVQLSSIPEIWGMIAGDGDGSGNIGSPDKNNIWNIQVGEKGYLESDYNLNMDVNNQDKNDFWHKNDGKATYIPD